MNILLLQCCSRSTSAASVRSSKRCRLRISRPSLLKTTKFAPRRGGRCRGRAGVPARSVARLRLPLRPSLRTRRRPAWRLATRRTRRSATAPSRSSSLDRAQVRVQRQNVSHVLPPPHHTPPVLSLSLASSPSPLRWPDGEEHAQGAEQACAPRRRRGSDASR